MTRTLNDMLTPNLPEMRQDAGKMREGCGWNDSGISGIPGSGRRVP